MLYSRQGREERHHAYCENGRDHDRANGRGHGSDRDRDRGHVSEALHAHGHSLGGRAYRRGCARHGYVHDVRRANRRVSANDHDLPHSGWWMIRETWS